MRLKIALAVFLVTALTAFGLHVALASDACASSNWDAWIKSYQPQVQYNSTLANGSANHTQSMIAAGKPYHDSSPALPNGYTKYGEIVGYGPNAATIQKAFVESPSHYAILAGNHGWTHYGYAVIIDSNGRMWVTVRYATIKTTTKPQPAKAAPAPKATPSVKASVPRTSTNAKPSPSNPRPTPTVTLTEETNEKTTYRAVPRIDEQPVYTGPVYGSC